ncbi:hypothetical protein PVAP13_3NG079674 [Panicum virgatum]|uniref:Uncharacterized protein n=1 Tax=Panicum virgatum TaxID=38727 RepID=A0A8T0U8J3_PANVG|nr:hypothetical protein PVAP13_3NG079674 [Panicum virgatum]
MHMATWACLAICLLIGMQHFFVRQAASLRRSNTSGEQSGSCDTLDGKMLRCYS